MILTHASPYNRYFVEKFSLCAGRISIRLRVVLICMSSILTFVPTGYSNVFNKTIFKYSPDIAEPGLFMDVAKYPCTYTHIDKDGYLYMMSNTSNNVKSVNIYKDESSRTYNSPGNIILSADIENGGYTAYSSGGDNVVYSWDIRSGHIYGRYIGHTAVVWSVRITTDNKYLLTASDDGLVMVWDAKTRNVIGRYSGHKGPAKSVDVNNDNIVASSGSDGRVHLYRIDAVDKAIYISPHLGNVNIVRWINNYIVACLNDGAICVLGYIEKRVLYKAKIHDNGIKCIDVIRGTDRIVTGSIDQRVVVWDVSQRRSVRIYAGHKDTIASAKWIDSNYIISSSYDMRIFIFNVSLVPRKALTVEFEKYSPDIVDEYIDAAIRNIKSGDNIGFQQEILIAAGERANDKVVSSIMSIEDRGKDILSSCEAISEKIVSGGDIAAEVKYIFGFGRLAVPYIEQYMSSCNNDIVNKRLSDTVGDIHANVSASDEIYYMSLLDIALSSNYESVRKRIVNIENKYLRNVLVAYK